MAGKFIASRDLNLTPKILGEAGRWTTGLWGAAGFRRCRAAPSRNTRTPSTYRSDRPAGWNGWLRFFERLGVPHLRKSLDVDRFSKTITVLSIPIFSFQVDFLMRATIKFESAYCC